MKNDPTHTATLDIAADSHVGLVRDINEDSFAYCADQACRNYFVAVADGIGGHESGDVASALCMRMMLVEWRNNRFCECVSETELSNFLESSVIRSNNVIHSINERYGIQHPMGTTVVAGAFLPDQMIVIHAGDSRCYMVRDKKLQQLTTDHSFVQELLKRKLITPEEVKNHPFSHIISRSVGPSANLEPEMNSYRRQPGDRFLFCSDGLMNHIDDEKIEEIVNHSDTAGEAVKELLYASLCGGGEDNITILCVFT